MLAFQTEQKKVAELEGNQVISIVDNYFKWSHNKPMVDQEYYL